MPRGQSLTQGGHKGQDAGGGDGVFSLVSDRQRRLKPLEAIAECRLQHGAPVVELRDGRWWLTRCLVRGRLNRNNLVVPEGSDRRQNILQPESEVRGSRVFLNCRL